MVKAIPQGGVDMNTIKNIVLAVLVAVFVAGLGIVANSSYAFSGIASITSSDPSEVQAMSVGIADQPYALEEEGVTGPLVSRNSRSSDWDLGLSLCPADSSYAVAEAAHAGPSVSTYARTSDWSSGMFSIAFLAKPC